MEKEGKSANLIYSSVLYDNNIDLPVCLLNVNKVKKLIENEFQVGIILVSINIEYEELNGWELFDSKRYALSIILKNITKEYNDAFRFYY